MTSIINNTAFLTTVTGGDHYLLSATHGQYKTPVGRAVDGETYPYKAIYLNGADGFETGRGIWRSSTNTLERTTIDTSSAGGTTPVTWGAGQKLVWLTVDEEYIDEDNSTPVTVGDTDEIDLTLDVQHLTAALFAGSIVLAKLDAGVQASLGLADSALQDLTGSDLSELQDVTITGNTSGELLKWSGSAWINNTLAEAGISAATHSHAAGDITSGTFDDARVAESNVTQHEAALTVATTQLTGMTAFGRSLVDDTNAIEAQQTLEVEVGVDVDPAGTDNSTNVSLNPAGEDYLGLIGQVLTANEIDLDNLSASGTPDATTFLRGDNTWAVPAGGGGGGAAGLGAWKFDSTTTEGGGPSGGFFRANNATPASITKLWVAEENADGVDMANFLSRIKEDDYIYIQEEGDSTKAQLFTVGATITDDGTYYDITVTHVDGGTGGLWSTPNKRCGLVVIQAPPIASDIEFTPDGDIAATNVQAAIVEVRDDTDTKLADKVDLAGDTMTGDLIVPDEAYDDTNWNGSLEVPTKNAVRDKISVLDAFFVAVANNKVDLAGDTMTGALEVPDEVYGVGWNASVEVPTKNAVYDKIESLAGGHDAVTLDIGSHDYLSLASQEITLGPIDLTADVTGDLPVADGGTGASTAAGARANLDVDQAGADNSTDVTLDTVSHDYLSIIGQDITLGPIDLTADVTGDLPVAEGGTGSSTAAGARTNLDVDQAGTDNSTDVTLGTGSHDYLSIVDQLITLGAIDLAADVTGTLPVADGGTGATTAAGARTNLDVDQAGTDNSTDVTLDIASHDYLSVIGQDITLGPIDLAADITGTLAVANGGTGATTAAGARTNLDVDQAGTDNSTDVTLAGTPDYITINPTTQVITRGLVDLSTDMTMSGTASVIATPNMTNPPYAVVFDEPTVNLVTNPRFHVGTTGWSATASSSISRSTTYPFIGPASLKIDTTAIDAGVSIDCDVDASTLYIFSVWVRGASGGEDIYLKLDPDVSAATESASVYRTIVPNTFEDPEVTTEYRRYRWYITTGGSDTSMTCSVLSYGATSQTIYITGAQLEAKTNPYPELNDKFASSYCDGDMSEGVGYTWAGTAHESISTRLGGYHYLGNGTADGAGFMAIRPDGSLTGNLHLRADEGHFSNWTDGSSSSDDVSDNFFPFVLSGDLATRALLTSVDAGLVKLVNTRGIATWIESGTTGDAGCVFSFPSLVSGTGMAIFGADDEAAMSSAGGKFFEFSSKVSGSHHTWYVDGQTMGSVALKTMKMMTLYGGGGQTTTATSAYSGTVSMGASSSTVTGSGTSFFDDYMPGDMIEMDAAGTSFASNTRMFTVESIESDTSLTLTAVGGAAFSTKAHRGRTRQYVPAGLALEGNFSNHAIADDPDENADYLSVIYPGTVDGQLYVYKDSERGNRQGIPTAADDGDPLVTRRYVTTTEVTVESTTSETTLFSGYTIPAWLLDAGKVIRLRMVGTLDNAGGATTDDYVYRVKLGSTNIVVTGATDVTTTTPVVQWEATVDIWGDGGLQAQKAFFSIEGKKYNSPSATQEIGTRRYQASTVDMRVDQALSVSAKPSASTLSITMEAAYVEIL